MLARLRTMKNDDGFTLIELLIVIVILGILAAVVVFAVGGVTNNGTLAACKADVTSVTTAAEAYLACPPPQPPACLLLDIRMPGMTGLELQRAIEGTPMELPIVFITGHADEELLQSLSRRTVNVLYKPLDDVALLAAIDAALAQSVES